MSEPKYRHGQEVKLKYLTDTFQVKFIKQNLDGSFAYGQETYCFHHEDDLELYQEPTKKVLYAFKIGEEIKFYDKETIIIETWGNKKPIIQRLKEYDLEYPSEEVK